LVRITNDRFTACPPAGPHRLKPHRARRSGKM